MTEIAAYTDGNILTRNKLESWTIGQFYGYHPMSDDEDENSLNGAPETASFLTSAPRDWTGVQRGQGCGLGHGPSHPQVGV